MSRSLSVRSKPGARILKFFKETQAELAKVTFPTREEGIRLTMVVMTVTLLAAGCLYALDLLFSYVITWLITV